MTIDASPVNDEQEDDDEDAEKCQKDGYTEVVRRLDEVITEEENGRLHPFLCRIKDGWMEGNRLETFKHASNVQIVS